MKILLFCIVYVGIFNLEYIQCDVVTSELSQSQRNHYLSLHFASTQKDPVFCYLYYKGDQYPVSINSKIGETFCIKESRLCHCILVVITPLVKERIRGEHVVGMEVSQDAPSAYYRLCYTVNDDGASYHWNIESIENPPNKIPEDALVIVAHPEAISIEPFQTSFRPPCPVLLNDHAGIVILPTFLIHAHAIDDSAALSAIDIGKFHTAKNFSHAA